MSSKQTAKQFTITYRDRFGLKFAVLDAQSNDFAIAQLRIISPEANIMSIRENNPALTTIVEVSSNA